MQCAHTASCRAETRAPFARFSRKTHGSPYPSRRRWQSAGHLARNWTRTAVTREPWSWSWRASFRRRRFVAHRSRWKRERLNVTAAINCTAHYRSVQYVELNSSDAYRVCCAHKRCPIGKRPSGYGSIEPIEYRSGIDSCIFRCPFWNAISAWSSSRVVR